LVWARSPTPARSALKHRPADVVSQPLVVEHEIANRVRELVTLPSALQSPCGIALAFRHGSTYGLDGIRGMPCCPTQVPGRAHCMAARRASLHHRDLTTHPGAGVLDRFPWSWVLRLNRLKQVKDVLRARRGPNSEQMMIRISEGPTATKRDEARVPNLREDHGWALLEGDRPPRQP